MKDGKTFEKRHSATLRDPPAALDEETGGPAARPVAKRGPRFPKQLSESAYAALMAERRQMQGKEGRPWHNTRDTIVALQYGKLAALAPRIVRRIEAALDDPDDPLHEMVMEKLMNRLLPQAFWDRLATREFTQDDGEKTPQVVINIAPAVQPVDVVGEQ